MRHFKIYKSCKTTHVSKETKTPVVAEKRYASREVARLIKRLTRGKSPGHDELSVQHFMSAAVHTSICEVLAYIFNLCLQINSSNKIKCSQLNINFDSCYSG